ncbi:GSCOCG00007050001-RA-CDS, partial [Cotesia congregata]
GGRKSERTIQEVDHKLKARTDGSTYVLRARINRNDLFLRLVSLLFYLFSFLFPFFHAPQRHTIPLTTLSSISCFIFRSDSNNPSLGTVSVACRMLMLMLMLVVVVVVSCQCTVYKLQA